jgi:transcriptional regulator, luxR family
MSSPIKIAVAEPSLIIRNGMLSVLKRLSGLNIQIVEIPDVSKLDMILRMQHPDILIINPMLLGVFSLQQIKGDVEFRKLKCVALQISLTDREAMKDYDQTISVYDTAEQIKEKIQQLQAELSEGDEEPTEQLSTREKEIIVCVVKGMTNKQVADQLCLSIHTVITHRRNIAAKLQIHSSAGLTIYAIVNKLVELNEIKDTIHSRED